MSDIIDKTCFIKVSQPLRAPHKNTTHTYSSTHLQFQPSLFNFKSYRKIASNSERFQGLVQIRQTQASVDIYLQAEFSKSQFILCARKIKNYRFQPIKSKQVRKIKIKELSKRSSLAIIDPYHIVIDLDSGDYFLKSPMYSSERQVAELSRKMINSVDGLVKKMKEVEVLMGRIRKFDKLQDSFSYKQKMDQTLKYNTRCTIPPTISLKIDCTEYQSLSNRYAASTCNLEQLDQNHKETLAWSSSALTSLPFFGYSIKEDLKANYLIELSLRQRQAIQEEIAIPSFTISKPKENKYIFSHCYFLQKAHPEKKIAQGGNSEIFVLRPEVYEITSTSLETEQIINRHDDATKYITKHLVIKKDIRKTDQNQDPDRPLITHQSKIVEYFQGGSCLFLSKYYLNIDRGTPYYRKLFSDYLPGDTLDDHLFFNSNTISIYTKIYLIMQVIQALRFVKNHGIVHLDVKENNIIVLRRTICKLIDFGESYHHKVCGNNHRPKYTLMYASPQVVTSVDGRIFTEKSDVFSLGIMAHKILFNRYPYFFGNQESFDRSNFEGTLRDKTFYTPEQIEEYGHEDLIGLIYQLILRCVDMAESKRPYLDWIMLILKSCFNILTSQ